MSEAIDTEAIAQFKRPGSEQDEVKGEIPSAYSVPLDEINPVWNRLLLRTKA